jgi:holo-[acyl-carrier protein] synthase
MIIRTGIDLVEVHRLAEVNPRIRTRFLQRVFTPEELRICKDSNEKLAGRFAVKEAVSKALGTGIGPISWQDVETLDGAMGEPILILYGKAQVFAEMIGLEAWSVSISDSGDLVMAVAAAVGNQGKPAF